jgi:hypothetical protein
LTSHEESYREELALALKTRLKAHKS